VDAVQEGSVVVTGKKVVLREKRLEDATDDYAWRTDEELSRLDATRPLNMSFTAFLKYLKDEMQYASPSSRRLAIDTMESRHIGNCMFYDISENRGEAELGIMIGDRDYWGKGFGTDCVDTLLAHIFATTALNRVYLHTLEWNHRARRSFAKSGFRELKKVHRSGLDFQLMEILRAEWELRQNGAAGKGPSAQVTPLPDDLDGDEAPER
jgi:RimJ/RimL family protein N-acetyltransferase